MHCCADIVAVIGNGANSENSRRVAKLIARNDSGVQATGCMIAEEGLLCMNSLNPIQRYRKPVANTGSTVGKMRGDGRKMCSVWVTDAVALSTATGAAERRMVYHWHVAGKGDVKRTPATSDD